MFNRRQPRGGGEDDDASMRKNGAAKPPLSNQQLKNATTTTTTGASLTRASKEKPADTKKQQQVQKVAEPDHGRASSTLARERWNILKQAIVLSSQTAPPAPSSRSATPAATVTRRFESFGFIKSVRLVYDELINNNNNNNNNEPHVKNKNKTKSAAKKAGDDDDDEDDENDDADVFMSASAISYNQKARAGKDAFQWFLISVPAISAECSVKARFCNNTVSLNQMIGFNNTGNVCLWPSEEIMTYFCVKNSVIFNNKSVCELGGGMTCLGGLMISKYSKPKEVFLTDGNETSFENLEVICSENVFECSVECCLLEWNKNTNYGDLENRFDYIICADCLFFDEYREHLCATIYKLLKPEGMCLIFAPNRHNTFHKFVDMAKLHFECTIAHDYDIDVWERHLYEKDNNSDYDEDANYPLLLKLKKRTRPGNNDFCKMVL